MTTTKYTFPCEKGVNFHQAVTWKNEDGAAVDNTDYQARMQVRKDADSEPVVTLTTEDKRIQLGGASGEVQMLLSAGDTAVLEPGKYVYDLELVNKDGEISRIVEGVFSVSGEIEHS